MQLPTVLRRALRRRLAIPCLALFLLLPGRVASAQSSGTWLNVGASTTWFHATDSNHTSNLGVGIAYRFGTSSTGWGPTIGFNWFETGLKSEVAGQRIPLGTIHVRPLMFGYGYTRKMGPVAMEVKGLVGYAFNNIKLDDQARQAYLRLGTWVSGGVRNSFVLKPEVNVWYDIAPRVGLNFSAGYLLTRPKVTLHTLTGTTTTRRNADMFVLSVGVVYGIF